LTAAVGVRDDRRQRVRRCRVEPPRPRRCVEEGPRLRLSGIEEATTVRATRVELLCLPRRAEDAEEWRRIRAGRARAGRVRAPLGYRPRGDRRGRGTRADQGHGRRRSDSEPYGLCRRLRLQERGYAGFPEFYKQFSAQGKASLRRLQWRAAEGGNVAAQIWLGKQWLGQRDHARTEITGSVAPLWSGQPAFSTQVLRVLEERHGQLEGPEDDPDSDDGA
jgi:hypothetical protein